MQIAESRQSTNTVSQNGTAKRSLFFQPKLTISQPNDIYEQEADVMADKVMRMPDPVAKNNFFFKPVISSVQRKCAHCEEEEEKAQRKETNNEIIAASTNTENYLNTLSGGRTLNYNERSFFEPRMGYDFSNVRLHTDSVAANSAQSINARAYTTGNNIVFNEGQFNSDTDNGKKLLGHELTHVVQQNNLATELSFGSSVLQRQPQVLNAPVSRSNLSGLRTISQGYIGDYFSAATSGLANFERDVQSNFDWTAFWVNVAGNVIWATASFATGGTAFVISLAGIALSTHASASTVTSAPDFHRETTNSINDIVTYLNNQVDRVTRDVDAEASANNWDDNRTRLELLHRLIDPNRSEFISIAGGGLPNLSQPAVSASVEEQLLLRASQMHGTSGVTHNFYGPARFEEVWRVEAFDYYQEPMSGYTYPVLRSQSNWFYNLQSASIVNAPPMISNINQAINNIYHTYNRPIGPADFPMEKRLILDGNLPFGVTYIFDSNNNLTRIDSPIFEGWLNSHGYNGRQYLTSLLQMIQTHAHAAIPTARQLS